MELFASLLAVLCMLLAGRIIYGNKKYALLQYDRDEYRDRANHFADIFWKCRDREDVLIQDVARWKKQAADYAKDWYDAKSEFGDAMAVARNRYREAEEIANEAMAIGLLAKRDAFEAGQELGFRQGIRDAVDTCLQYPTSKGSTLAKRLKS